MLIVETVARIRRDHLGRGIPIKQIARDLKLSRNTVRKVVRSDETSFRYERSVQPLPKLGPWVEELDRLLEANEDKRRRDRLSLVRIYEELAGLGYDGGYDAVRRYAASWRRKRSGSAGASLRPADLRSRRGLPVRLESRVCGDRRRHRAGQGGAPAAVPQSPLSGSDFSARGPGDGVRGPRAELPVLRRGLSPRHLRQHEDGGADGVRRQGTRLQRALSSDVFTPPDRSRSLQPRGRLGEGSGGEPGGDTCAGVCSCRGRADGRMRRSTAGFPISAWPKRSAIGIRCSRTGRCGMCSRKSGPI